MSIKTVILQFICPDKPGLVSDLASWIASKNGNIRHADHHTDADAKLFLSRIEWDLDGFLLDKNEIKSEVKEVNIGTEDVQKKDKKGTFRMSFIEITLVSSKNEEN